MSAIEQTIQHWEFARELTLATLDTIAELPDPSAVLGWQSNPGRAHLCWQLMHIAITEEIFATAFLQNSKPGLPDLIPRFMKDSVADDQIHSPEEIRETLALTREHLLESIRSWEGKDLSQLTPGRQEREWTVEKLLMISAWHEAHHQGQAHFCLNSWKAAQK
ncbi:DinB superfamily protein [Polystyrenella longa]|uniref:DinB superfamily protein n=1 Tax=Polystyrenella longa TaxID=2528007 RepID=A0A518CHH1_9PLAN|nr:DinB family protein [Polystyrenella longa]QDU78676.1 DinB superfamily protein [Polystyrenella longa]